MESGTLSEVAAFRDFLTHCIEAGNVQVSVEECLEEWRRLREPTRESLAAVREDLAEAEAGLGQPYRQFLDELRADNQTAEHE
jgi:hypothetical protein